MNMSVYTRDEVNGHYDIHMDGKGRRYRIRGRMGAQTVYDYFADRSQPIPTFPSLGCAMLYIASKHMPEPITVTNNN